MGTTSEHLSPAQLGALARSLRRPVPTVRREAPLPPDAANATWSGVGDRSQPLRLRPEIAAARRWLALSPPPSLVVIGPVGVGKTCLLALLARRLVRSGHRVAWTSVPALFEDLWNDDLWRPATEAPYLIADDLGNELSCSRSARERFFALVDARWQGRRPTLWSTNVNLTADRRWAEDRYGEATVSRLTDPTQTRVLVWSHPVSARDQQPAKWQTFAT